MLDHFTKDSDTEEDYWEAKKGVTVIEEKAKSEDGAKDRADHRTEKEDNLFVVENPEGLEKG